MSSLRRLLSGSPARSEWVSPVVLCGTVIVSAQIMV